MQLPRIDSRLPRVLRLVARDFALVIQQGKAFRGRRVSVLLKENGLVQPRLGMIVPKRLFQRAVDRSRCKRIIREWFRAHKQQLAGRDCVVRLVTRSDEGDLLREIEHLLATKGRLSE